MRRQKEIPAATRDVVRASDYATWREATARTIVQADEVSS